MIALNIPPQACGSFCIGLKAEYFSPRTHQPGGEKREKSDVRTYFGRTSVSFQSVAMNERLTRLASSDVVMIDG